MGWIGDILLGTSIISNGASFGIGIRQLDQKQSLYYILSLDSFLTGLASASLITTSLIGQAAKEDVLNGFFCSVIFASHAVVPATFPLFNLLTAIIR